MTRDEIYIQITSLMHDIFEIEKDKITPESTLQEDLDIDSIDAVDLMLELKNLTGQKVSPEQFHDVKTVQDIVIAIEKLLENKESEKEADLEKTP